jgi:hypothetical protein
MVRTLRQVVGVSCAVLSINASAGLVTGDNVTLTFAPSGGSSSFTIRDGVDLQLGTFAFDLNAGVDGMIFDFQSAQRGFLGGSSSFTVSSLLFEGGYSLTGFDLFQTNMTNLAIFTTADSITFSYDPGDGSTFPGTVIRGRYITNEASVPEPATLVLFGLSLVGLAASRRRTKQWQIAPAAASRVNAGLGDARFATAF